MSNSISITGNLVRPSEVRFTKSNKPVTTLTVAHTPRLKSNGEWVDGETLFFKVTVWDNLPEILYDKGARVTLTGTLSMQVWEKDGERKTQLAIETDSVGIITRVKAPDNSNQFAPSAPVANSPYEDDMPF